MRVYFTLRLFQGLCRELFFKVPRLLIFYSSYIEPSVSEGIERDGIYDNLQEPSIRLGVGM